MLKREEIMLEFWKRVAATTGMNYTARNPVSQPSKDDMPVGNIFDFPAKVTKVMGGSRAGIPVVQFTMNVILEVFIVGTNEYESTNEFFTFYTKVLKSIFTDGASLGSLNCSIAIQEMTRIFRPPIGSHTVGMGTVFSVQFFEDFNNL